MSEETGENTRKTPGGASQICASFKPFPMVDNTKSHHFEIGTPLSVIVEHFQPKGKIEVRVGPHAVPEEGWHLVRPKAPVVISGVPDGPAAALIPTLLATAAGKVIAASPAIIGALGPIGAAALGAGLSEANPSVQIEGKVVDCPPLPADFKPMISLEGRIGIGFNTPERVAEFLIGCSGPIDVLINSLGGMTDASLRMYRMLRDYPGEVHVLIRGTALSAGAIVAMAGDRIRITTGSQMMIHPAAFVDQDENITAKMLRTMLACVEDLDQQTSEIFVQRTGQTLAIIQRLMAEEVYLDAEEAVAMGFADQVAA